MLGPICIEIEGCHDNYSKTFIWRLLAFLIVPILAAHPANTQSLAFKQEVAEAAVKDRDIAAFYKEIG